MHSWLLLPAFVATATLQPGVSVKAVDASTGTPLPGSFVRLSEVDGDVNREALVDPTGLVSFLGLPVGEYMVSVERTGYRVATQDVRFSGSASRALVVPLERRFPGSALPTPETGACESGPLFGEVAESLWNEIRKGLTVLRWTEESSNLEVTRRRYSRVVDPRAGQIVLYEASEEQSTRGVAVIARGDSDLLPPLTLPTAETFLSPAFLEGHCFRTRRSTDATRIGLGFEAVTEPGALGIAGTFWIEPRSGELNRLDVVRVDAGSERGAYPARGYLVFRRLGSGEVIASEWQVSGPAAGATRPDETDATPVYLHEQGAHAIRVQNADEEVIWAAGLGTVRGSVFTEDTRRPLSGVRVSLEGQPRSATTDRSGAFVIDSVLPGPHIAVGRSLNQRIALPIEVAPGSSIEVNLLMDDPYADHAAACSSARGPGGGDDDPVLIGHVLEPGSGVVLGGATVLVTWNDQSDPDRRGSIAVQATEEGAYRVCGVPREVDLTVTAQWLGHDGGRSTVRVAREEYGAVANLWVPVGSSGLWGGQVEDWSTGAAVEGATVTLTPTNSGTMDPAHTFETGSNGRFSFDEVTAGQYEIVATAAGFAPVTDTVDMPASRAIRTRIRLPRTAVEIEGIMVEVEAHILRLDEAGFYDRKREGLGFFLDADEILPRLPTPVVQLFDGVPGVTVGTTAAQAGAREVLIIGNCLPTLFVDGVLARRSQPFFRNPNPMAYGPDGPGAAETSPLYLSDLVTASQVAGIEVYRSPAELPLQYGGTALGSVSDVTKGEWGFCGVVLVWTH